MQWCLHAVTMYERKFKHIAMKKGIDVDRVG